MNRLFVEFAEELRAAGVPVSMVETIDAVRAVTEIDLSDRSALRSTLLATMVKDVKHLPAFDIVFEVFFSNAPPVGTDDEPGQDEGSSASDTAQPRDTGDIDELLRESLLEALERLDLEELRRQISRAVDRYAGIEPGRPVGGTYYLYRTLRRLESDSMAQALRDALGTGLDEDGDPLDGRLLDEDVERRIEMLRNEIEADIRRRLVADRGRDAMARTLRQTPVEDLDLMHASRQELDDLEHAIAPLARKLAARLTRRRHHLRQGRLDFRRTVRASLATGGVPVDPRFRRRRPHRPEVFLACDVSGSMATFARFTLLLTYSLSTQFSRLRSFAFVDSMDEITEFFGPGTDAATAISRIATEAKVVSADGHSDYGAAFESWNRLIGGDITSRSTLIIAGDARNNYRPARDETLGVLGDEARSVLWLNPEPRSYWDSGDSLMSRYGRHCDKSYEVRTLAQLEHFIEELVLP